MNNVLSAWINSGLYRKNHADRKYRGMLGRFEKLVAGCIFRGTSIGVQYDRKISIKDLNRAHSQFAKLVLKNRRGAIIEVKNQSALVFWTTTFKGTERPPIGKETDYIRLVHSDTHPKAKRAEDGRVEHIRFSGSGHPTKKSFIQFDQPEYVDIRTTPMAPHGMLEVEDFAPLADMMKLPEGHQLRVRGQKLVDEEKEKEKSQRVKDLQREKPAGVLDMVGADYQIGAC